MAEVKIWPRGQNETGGILLMPMKKNIPKGHPEWSLVKCPICGQECWRPMSRQELRQKKMQAACTECGLKIESRRNASGNARNPATARLLIDMFPLFPLIPTYLLFRGKFYTRCTNFMHHMQNSTTPADRATFQKTEKSPHTWETPTSPGPEITETSCWKCRSAIHPATLRRIAME